MSTLIISSPRMLMEIQVQFRSQQNISWASQQNSVAALSFLFETRKTHRMDPNSVMGVSRSPEIPNWYEKTSIMLFVWAKIFPEAAYLLITWVE